MIKPPKLEKNAVLGIICPSYHIEPEIYEKTSNIFLDRGFKIIKGNTITLKNHLYAGTPEQRAADIMDMFKNPDIDAIICARGGYGANRVLPLLDYELIKKHPKIFIGYSDITAFLLSITQRTGLITFHGPMLSSYSEGLIDYNFNSFLEVVNGTHPIKIQAPKQLEIRVLRSGIAKGALIGGNLTLLINRLGTADNFILNDSILFIEDTKEYYHSFDRMLYQLKEAGILNLIKGLIVGELTEMTDTDPSFGRSTDEIVMDICDDFDIPIVTNFPCGHGKYQATLPISIIAQLDADGNDPNIKITESPVE